MEIKYEIPDDKVCNFTDDAKNRLQAQSYKYTLEIITESEKIEEFFRENGASTEITDNIVHQAVRRNRTEPKKNKKLIFLRIGAEILIFISGLMFIPEKFISNNSLNIGYSVAFLLVTLFALGTTMASIFMGGD